MHDLIQFGADFPPVCLHGRRPRECFHVVNRRIAVHRHARDEAFQLRLATSVRHGRERLGRGQVMLPVAEMDRWLNGSGDGGGWCVAHSFSIP